MIDREKLTKILDARDALEGVVKVEITIYESGTFRVWVSKPIYWEPLPEEARHKALSVLAPLVGKIDKITETDWKGEANGINVFLSGVSECKVVGYKTVKKMVKKEVVREPEYEEVEEEEKIMITDCDIKQGKYSEDDIEVPA